MNDHVITLDKVPVITRAIFKLITETVINPLREELIGKINTECEPAAAKPTAKDILDALWADDADGHALRAELYANIRDKMLDDPVFVRKITSLMPRTTPRTTTPAARNDEDTDAKIGEIISKQLEGLDPKDVTNLTVRIKNANILSGVEPDKWNVAISGWIEGGVETLMGAISNLCKRGATAKFDVRAYARLLFLSSAKAEELDNIRDFLANVEGVKEHLKK